MKCWPVPDSHTRAVPEKGTPGSFWEDRGDRHHCGVDIYAPQGSAVKAVEAGDVIEVGAFTWPEMVPYWNRTYYVLLRHEDGFVCKYAELGDVTARSGESVRAGQILGHVGAVINSDLVSDQSPPYVRRLKENGNQSMLHFELYIGLPAVPASYLGGNAFHGSIPEHLADATAYLKNAAG